MPYYYIYNTDGTQVWLLNADMILMSIRRMSLPGQLYGNCPQMGDVEGYVFNYDGLAIAGATIGAEDGPTATSGPNGYYLLENVDGGSISIVCA